MKKRIIIVVFVLILLGVGFVVYLGQRKSRTEELYYSGTIEATTSELAFQVDGRIVNIHADEGQGVEEGQLLAELDRSEYQARYEQAQANLNQVQQNIRKLETVLEMYRGNSPLLLNYELMSHSFGHTTSKYHLVLVLLQEIDIILFNTKLTN